jgi:hypothetical protein
MKLNVIYELIWVKSIVDHLQIPKFLSAQRVFRTWFCVQSAVGTLHIVWQTVITQTMLPSCRDTLLVSAFVGRSLTNGAA